MKLNNTPLAKGLPFLILLLLEISRTLYLTFSHRIGLHDTFDQFSLFYFFLNNKVVAGEIPQWIPYLTHGRSTFMYYAILGIASFFANIPYWLGGLIKSINFIPVYHWTIFADKLILLIGTWLLSSRYYASSYSRFFVTSCVMGSCIWMTQIHFNFYIYYLLPLIIYFFHRFIDTGQWRYCFLTFNLLIIQTAGNVAYLVPIITLALFLYFLFYYVFNVSYIHSRIKNLRWGGASISCLAALFITAIPVFILLKMGKGDDIAIFTPGRNLNGEVGLFTFLTHGGNIDLKKFIELLLGISPSMDYNLYIGLLPLPLIIFSLLFKPKKDCLIFLYLTVIFTLFSIGTWVSIFFYHTWPLMKFFRHIALVAPLVKIFLCFMAGFGFESLFFKDDTKKSTPFQKYSYMTMCLVILTHAIVMFVLCKDHLTSLFLVNELKGAMPHLKPLFHGVHLYNRLFTTSLFSFVLFMLLSTLSYLKSKYRLKHIVLVFLIFHVIDIYSYVLSETNLRTVRLNKEQLHVTQFQDLNYNMKRLEKYEGETPREDIISVKLVSTGVFNWQASAILFKDTLHTPLRVDHAAHPLDTLIYAYTGRSISDFFIVNDPSSWRLTFPINHPSSLKVTGVNKDKIQLFSDAFIFDSDQSIAKNIRDKKYTGDLLFLSQPKTSNPENPAHRTRDPQNFLRSDMRIDRPYAVSRFDANNIVIHVSNPGETLWLYYADVWHPLWKATVNDKPVDVWKANLAYKAVLLEPGKNVVHLYFRSKLFESMHTLIGINAIFWFLLMLIMLARIIIKKEI